MGCKLGQQNPLKVQRAMSQTFGTAKSFFQTRTGDILVELFDITQYNKALSTTQLGEWKIKVSVPRIMTTSRGCIYNVPLDFDLTEVGDILKDQNIVKVDRMSTFDKEKKKGYKSKLLSWFLTRQVCPRVLT